MSTQAAFSSTFTRYYLFCHILQTEILFWFFVLFSLLLFLGVKGVSTGHNYASTKRETTLDRPFLPFHWPRAHHLPANNGLFMRNVVQLCLAANNILLVRKRNHAFLLLAIALAWKMADRFPLRRYSLKNKLGDRMIEQLVNSVIAKYRDFSVSRRSIICLSLRLWQISYLLAIDKSWYFA